MVGGDPQPWAQHRRWRPVERPKPDASVEHDPSYLRRVLDTSRSVTAVIGLDGTVRYASAGICDLVGIPHEDVSGASVFDWLHPDDLDRAARSLVFTEEVGSIRYFPMSFRIRRTDGSDVELDVLAANLLEDGAIAGIVLDIRRADERTQFVEPIGALAEGASHREVLELIASGVGRGGDALRPAFIAWDRDPTTGRFGQLEAVRSPAHLTSRVQEALAEEPSGPGAGWSDLGPRALRAVLREELPSGLGAHLAEAGYRGLRLGGIAVSGDVVGLLFSAERAEVWQGGRWSPSMEGHWEQLLDLATVAFERQSQHSRLLHAATHDSLTGLANRDRFFSTLERMAQRADVAVLYVDLDEFKAVNDEFGHACGDDVLVEVARRLNDTVRPEDLVARLGGDEFAVAVAAADRVLVAELADRLASAVSAPLDPRLGVERVGVSIGLSHARPHQAVDDLVRAADRALLTAKRLGRGRVVVG